jgi:hypothetical protein
VALLLTAPAGPAPRQAPASPASLGQRLELVVRFPPWQFTGTFTLSGAGLEDHGAASDAGTLGGEAEVERVLSGERGTLVLALRGQFLGASFPRFFGHWRVTGGTGAYAGLTGGGTFTATSADLGSAQGSTLELQALVGRVLAPRRAPGWGDQGPAALRPVGPAPER